MILRRRSACSLHIFVCFSLLFATFVTAQDDTAFNCRLTVDSFKFDLTALAGEHNASRTRETPPTSMVDFVRFDLCGDLEQQTDVPPGDQCPAGTRACLTKVNKKAEDSDRIVAVIPVAQTASLTPQYSTISSPKGLSLAFHGASYPNPSTSVPTPQIFNITLFCAIDTTDATFSSYDGSQLHIEWSAPAGCAFKGDQPPENGGSDGGTEDNGRNQSVGSGIGWFFLVLLLAFAAYFGLGAYYNYSTYGATGADLIPHRDFWKEVPYMLHDVISHLCSSVRPRRSSSRGGYIAV